MVRFDRFRCRIYLPGQAFLNFPPNQIDVLSSYTFIVNSREFHYTLQSLRAQVHINTFSIKNIFVHPHAKLIDKYRLMPPF